MKDRETKRPTKRFWGLGLGRFHFVRSVAILAGGTAIAQGLGVLTSPILTRLYSPAESGKLGLYMAFMGIVTVLLSLRYDAAIIAADDRKEAANLVVASVVLSIPLAGFFTLVLYLMTKYALLGFDSLSTPVSLVVFPALILTALANALRNWFVREEDFSVVSQVTVYQSGARMIGQLGFGYVQFGWMGLLWGDLLGRIFGIGRIVRLAWGPIKHTASPVMSPDMYGTLYKYRRFPLYSLPSTALDTLAQFLSVLLIAQIHGSEAAGYFALVQRVFALPVTLVGGSVAEAFHARIASLFRTDPEKAKPFFLRTALVLFGIGVVPLMGLWLYGPELFGLVFGQRWVISGTLAAVMTPWMLAQLVVSPLSRAALVYQGLRLKLVYDTLSLITVVGVFALGQVLGLHLVQTVELLGWCKLITYAVYFGLLLHIVDKGR